MESKLLLRIRNKTNQKDSSVYYPDTDTKDPDD